MNRILGAILLITGMAVGTGMLALPILTAFSGFFPTLILLVISWIFMVLTGLMVADVNLFVGLESNLISMSQHTLGKAGKMASWFCYLVIFYSVQAAHIEAAFPIFQDWFPFMPNWILPLLLTIVFGWFIYKGTHATDRINRFIIAGLIAGYILLIIFAPKHMVGQRLFHADFTPTLLIIPILIVALGFQNIVPTICTYLAGDRKKIYLSIILGTLIPLILYLLFEGMVLSVVPLQGDVSLTEAYRQGASAINPLLQQFKDPLFKGGVSLFSFCAIACSFMGIGLSLIDFLTDGLKLSKDRKGRFLAFFLAFIVPTLFVYLYPEGFLFSMQFAGIFLIFLIGILPCLMAFSLPEGHFWKSRQGKMLLVTTLIFFIFAEILSVLVHFEFIKKLFLKSYLSI